MKNFVVGMLAGAALAVTGFLMYLTGKAKSGMLDTDESLGAMFDDDDDYDEDDYDEDDYDDEDEEDKKESDKFWSELK